MIERLSQDEALNPDTADFLNEFVKRNISKYRDLWLQYQSRLQRFGNDGIMEFGYPFGQIYKHKDQAKSLGEELEFRGFTLKKFREIAPQTVTEKKDLPLPSFLAEDLGDWVDILSTKGVILDTNGKIVRFENRGITSPKVGGAFRVFPGYQLALFIKYGTVEKPSEEPVDYKLVNAEFLKKAVTYKGIYLG